MEQDVGLLEQVMYLFTGHGFQGSPASIAICSVSCWELFLKHSSILYQYKRMRLQIKIWRKEFYSIKVVKTDIFKK